MNDYQKIITVNKTVQQVYAAITEHIAQWWSNDLMGAAVQAGDSFSIAFGKTKKTFNITKAIPDQQVEWTCVKAYINNPSLENKAEWVGTKIIWTISSAPQGATLNFLHQGLDENLQCFNLCQAGWDMFLASLQTYLTTGIGKPFLKAAEN